MQRLIVSAILAFLGLTGSAHATTYLGVASASSSGATCSPTYTTTAGSSLAVVIAQGSPTARTYSVADGVNTWGTERVRSVGATASDPILLIDTHNAGATSAIVVTQAGGGALAYTCTVVEWSGAPIPDPAGAGAGSCTITTGSCDTFENGAVLTIYGSNNAGGTIDTSAGAFILVASHGTAANGGYTAGMTTGGIAYTEITASSLTYIAYAIAVGAETNEHGTHTQDLTRRAQASFIVAWAPSTSPTAPPVGSLNLGGAGR